MCVAQIPGRRGRCRLSMLESCVQQSAELERVQGDLQLNVVAPELGNRSEPWLRVTTMTARPGRGLKEYGRGSHRSPPAEICPN